MDTLGFFTGTAADMLGLWGALGHSTGQLEDEDVALGVPDPLPDVDPAMAFAFRSSLAALKGGGFSIRSLDLTETLERLNDASDVIMFYEAARIHQPLFAKYGDRLFDLADLIRKAFRSLLSVMTKRDGAWTSARKRSAKCMSPFR
ncbi:MAG: hypothetical protein HY657_05725 [Acidobacteria bacterium]|nr:hypothetical protein [Acidobacteriota bacterium]